MDLSLSLESACMIMVLRSSTAIELDLAGVSRYGMRGREGRLRRLSRRHGDLVEACDLDFYKGITLATEYTQASLLHVGTSCRLVHCSYGDWYDAMDQRL